MTTPKTALTSPAPVEDQTPWVEPAPARLPNPEAAWVAWWNFSVPVEQYDFENGQEYVEYVPLSITIRDGEPVTNLFEQVAEFAKMALLNGWVPISDKQWTAMDVSGKPKAAFAPPPVQTSSPLPPAAQPGQSWQPQQQAKPAGQWTPPQGGQQQPQAPRQQAGALDNTFIADALLVANKNKLDGTPYIEYSLKGSRYPTFGVRVYPDRLNEVLPGWGDAPVGLHPLPAHYKCTFSWDTKLGKDGTPRPKNVYAMELAQ